MSRIKLLFFTLALTITQLGFAQLVDVSGKVTDQNGEPIPGANVVVKGKDKGTATDFDGNYSISVNVGDVLVFSSLGYQNAEKKVTGAGTINVTLKEGSDVLDKVVVTAMGISRKKKSLGYAVQEVKAKDLALSGKNNALEALQGQVAGLQLTRTSGSAGGGVDILIRGMSSINPGRNNQPLIVVDGVPINNDTFTGNVLPSDGSNASGSSEQFSFSNRFIDLNPDDIESFNVLKGAAATALYGIRAANGAIIITTKKGKLGKPQINFSVATTTRKVVTTPELQTTYREGHRTTKKPGAIIDDTQPDGFRRYGFAFYSWGPKFTEDEYVLSDGTVIDLTHDAFHDPYELFRTGINNQINFNISGADEKIDYYLSTGYSNNEGILPNTDYAKKNIKFKGGYKLSDRVKIESSIAFTNSGGSRANSGDKSVFSSLSYWSATFPINDYLTKDGRQKNYSNGVIDNPRYFLEKSNLTDDVNRWIANTKLNWDVNDWLNLNYTIQYDNYADLRNRYVPADLDVGTKVGGFIVNENINFKGLESNFMATFTKDFSEDLKTTFILGNQVSSSDRTYSYIRGEGLNVPDVNDLSNTTNIFGGQGLVRLRNVGVFGDFRLAYKDKLFLSLTGRNDWLSSMPEKNRSFFYPSASLSYIFTDLFGKNDILSFGKLRLSYAQVGKGPGFGKIGHFFYKDSNFPFQGTVGYSFGHSDGDLDLIPERSNSYEYGLDMRFFNNRLHIDYAYYDTKVTDQIFPVGTAYSSGLSREYINAGDYENKGHELLVGYDVIRKNNLKWNAYINYSTNEGIITELPDELGGEIHYFDDRITAKSKVGDKVGSLYGWVFMTRDGERYVNSDGKWVITGDKNEGYYYQNDNEMVLVGNAFPDYILSLGNKFSYNKIGLSFLLEYKKGGDIYDKGYRNSLRNGNLKETELRDEYRVLDGVMDDGNGGYTKNTQELLITANSYYRDWNNAAEVLLQDGSWLKLRNIKLSYDLGKKLIEKVNAKQVTISASANNILLWTPYKGFDPEGSYFSAGSNIYGYNGLNVPLSRDISFGLNVKF